jgi:glutaredoxin
MLKFYRTSDCPRCGHIQDALEKLNIVHEVIQTEKAESIEGLPQGMKLPVLVDEEKLFEGSEAILRHLEELEEFKTEWYKFQSDSCYCNDQGEVE